MSIAFPARKEKRPRTSSNETNTSFVKNVTSRVSGLLPATITRWFSSPKSSNTNGSTPTVDITDSSTEDEGPENPVVTQPQAKRMRFSSPNSYNHFSPTDANCCPSNIEMTEMPVTPYPGTQFSTRSLDLTPIRTLNEAVSNESMKNKSERESSRYRLTQPATSSKGHSIAVKRKSIFDKTSDKDKKVKTTTKPSTSNAHKPYFKPRLLGSPFYPGRTMYGGAASSYVNQANIQQHTVAYVKDTKNNEDSAMSSSTRRIMELLEQYSSPLREARRIPAYTCTRNDTLNSLTEHNATKTTQDISYKKQELSVPNIASILMVKQKSRLMDTTKTARQIIASHSSAQNYQMPYPSLKHTPTASIVTQTTKSGVESEQEKSNKMTTKVKANVTRTNRGMPDHLDVATPVKLPAATLQIDQNNLPKFSFNSPAVSKLPVTSTPKASHVSKLAVTNTDADVPTSKQEIVTSSSLFKFSNPDKISSDTPDADTTPPKFTFDSPERRIEHNCDGKSDDFSVVGNVRELYSTSIKPNWQCPDCWVSNKADAAACVCCGYKTKKAAKCVVCKIADSLPQNEKCAICSKMASPPAAMSQSSKWKCEDCWVANEASVNKCACCGTVKPTAEQVAARAAKNKAIPKVNAPSCKGCFSFSIEDAKIETRENKPGTLTTTPFSISSFGKMDKTDSTFKTIAESQKSEKWECSSCLVRNESDKSECVCCGSDKEPKSKLPQSKFNFGLKTKNSFNFGIDPKVQEKAIVNKAEAKTMTEPTLKEQSEKQNNLLSKGPTFIFTVPNKEQEIKVDAVIPKGPNKFSFGIPKDASPLPKKTVLAKVTDEDNEKPQEVPVVNFTSIAKEAPQPGGLFASPPTQQAVKNKPMLTASNLISTPTADAKKDVTSAIVPVQPLTSTINKPQGQSAFTLGSSTLKPSSNVFGAPAAGSSSANLFTVPAQGAAAATSSFSVPSLLPAQKNETTSSVAPPVAPLFSFGNSATMPAATAAPIADKPKFQFTFGSNTPKPDAAPAPSLLNTSNSQLFKSPFGSAPDNNAKNTSSFGITGGGNTLGSSNAFGGSNGLATTNGLTGNMMSGSMLGTSPLGGNTLGSNTLGSNTLGSNTLGSNTMGINPLGGNTLGGALTGNGMSNNLLGGNVLGANSFSAISTSNNTSGNCLPSNSLAGNVMQTNNTLTSGSSNIFGSPVQKENMWNTNNNTPSPNLFVSNAPSNNLQKAPAFSFGTATPFNASSPPPAFNTAAQPSSHIFGMGNQNNNSQPSPFSHPAQNQSPAPMFGSPQPASHPPPQMGMFGTSNMATNPTFGAPNPTMPTFETSMTPAPAFNFGAPSQAPGIFGFGQQQAQQQPQQAGVYSFGGAPTAPAGQVQFNMGTAPAGRRLRKAVRRTTPR